MKTTKIVIFLAVIFWAGEAIGQSDPSSDVDKAVQRKVKKQIIVQDTENRIRELSLAAPRVMARYRLARWLWSDGKDEIGRAEEFAVLAIDDLYKNRNEVPSVYFATLSADLFALLDRHSPRASKPLKDKHKFTAIDEANAQDARLDQPGQEKATVDDVIRSLYLNEPSDYQLPGLLHRLKQTDSPELFRLLNNLVAAEERIPGRLSSTTLTSVTPYFAIPEVEMGTSRRFARIIVDRSRAASQAPFAEFDQWLEIVNANMPMINQRSQDLIPETEVVRAVLSSRISQSSREERERNDRINNSIDKLGALIDEAEKSENAVVKYDLYRRAARLALEQNLFRRSVDLALLFGDVDVSTNIILKQTQKNEVGQMLEAVVAKALKSEDDMSAVYAVERLSAFDRKANGYATISKYFLDNGNRDAARTTMQSAIRAAADVESLPRRASVYFRMIPISQRIDPTSVFEINALAARSINVIPSLNVEDKPDTENFRNHVTGLMIVNWNLLPMLTDYAKVDRNGASDLSGRIEKKEVKVIAEMIMSFQSLDDVLQINTEKPKAGDPRQ